MAVLATFRYEEDFLAAAERVKTAGIGRISLMSPVPLEAAQEVLGLEKSPVRRFSLAGALIGAVSGFALAVATALVFILPTGGRAIISVPPYLVIAQHATRFKLLEQYGGLVRFRTIKHGSNSLSLYRGGV